MQGSGLFQRSINRQIEINQARTPSERMAALCELLDAARELAPRDPEAQARRVRADAVRQHDREQWRVRCGSSLPPSGQTLSQALKSLVATFDSQKSWVGELRDQPK